MRQLSIIYLVSGAVLLVGVLLISMSPDHRQALSAFQNPRPIALHHAGPLPLYFLPHRDEPTEKTVFYAQTSRYTMWTTSEGLVFDRGGQAAANEENVSRLVFLNANRDPGIIPLEISNHLGTISAKAILYKNLYDRIDLKICGNESQIEYTWIVKPGGNPADIHFEYKNVKATGIDNQWNLAIETPGGELTQQKPSSYQLIAGEKRTIPSHFEPIAKNLFGFRIKAFDRDHDLIIDPPVSFRLSTHRQK